MLLGANLFAEKGIRCKSGAVSAAVSVLKTT